MRGLMRNKRWIFFKNYLSTAYVENEQGKKTGRRKTVYSDVRKVHCSVSTPNGTTEQQMFGKDLRYDKYLVIDDPNFDLNENSIFWIDKKYGADVSYDYFVVKILDNHNFLTVALRKVDVKNEQTDTVSVEP